MFGLRSSHMNDASCGMHTLNSFGHLRMYLCPNLWVQTIFIFPFEIGTRVNIIMMKKKRKKSVVEQLPTLPRVALAHQQAKEKVGHLSLGIWIWLKPFFLVSGLWSNVGFEMKSGHSFANSGWCLIFSFDAHCRKLVCLVAGENYETDHGSLILEKVY